MNGTRKERLALSSKFGATHTINVREVDPYKSIMDITNGYGVDVVLFCGGGKDAFQMAESILAPFGRIIVEALPAKYDAKWPITVFKFTERSISILGISGYNSQQFSTALNLIENKKIKLSPLITHRFTPDEFSEAFKTSEKRKEGAMKVMFSIGSE